MRRLLVLILLLVAAASRAQTNPAMAANDAAVAANAGAPINVVVVNGTPTDGQVIEWQASTTSWIPATVAGGGGSFSALTSGTNTTAAMVCGTGCSMAASGSGSITATAVAVGNVTGLGSGIATWLATPSVANFASALTGAPLTAAVGGTNNAFFAVAGPASSTKTFTFPNASANVLTDNAAVTVGQGGTGAGTFTAHGVLLGNTTSAFNVTGVGTTGQCLTGNTGADPTWSTCGSGFVNLQSTTPGTQQGSGGSGNINVNGVVIEEVDALGAASATGTLIQNTTAALVGTQAQFSPSLQLCGTGWNTGGSASEVDCWRINNQTAGGNPSTNLLRFQSSINGGAFANEFTLSGTGAGTFTQGITFTGSATGTANNTQFVVSGSTAGVGGLLVNYQNSGSGLVTGNRFVSVACSSGTTCDSGTNLPANAVVLSVAYRITTAITGATTIELGTATNAAAFCTGLTTLTVNTTGVCSGGPTVGAGVNGAAVAVRATATAGTFSAGVIEYEITYILATPPTS